jgi:SAM-dependent methyltransferase
MNDEQAAATDWQKKDINWADIIDWDIKNWSSAIPFWFANTALKLNQCKALEIGSHNGGLSLCLGLHGAQVVCSDLNGPTEKARQNHEKYGVSGRITYAAVSATEIPYADSRFDLVVFKSVLGALGTYEKQERMMKEIHRVLRPAGEVWFADNLRASPLHMLARRTFVEWGHRWRYLYPRDVHALCQPFHQLISKNYGFFAAFGRSESQRRVLAAMDRYIDKLMPSSWKYIVFGIARK